MSVGFCLGRCVPGLVARRYPLVPCLVRSWFRVSVRPCVGATVRPESAYGMSVLLLSGVCPRVRGSPVSPVSVCYYLRV